MLIWTGLVFGQGSLRLTAPSVGNWLVYLRARINFRPLGSSVWSEVTYAETSTSISGKAIGFTYSSGLAQANLEPRGNGDYQVTIAAHGICGGQDVPLTPSNPAPSNILPVSRPTITGPGGTAGPYGIWWLGGGSDDSNGYFNRVTLSVNANGSPGSPTWSVPFGANKVSLSCTSCTSPLVTSTQPSSNCTYDVGVRVNYGGFNSENLYVLNVNAPFYVQSGGLSSTSNYGGDGWLTVVPYLNRDRCTYPMPSIALNETFGQFTPSSWTKPTAGGTATYGGYTWYDQIFVTGCTNCVPPSQQDNPLGQAFVDQAQQFWQVGSSTPGFGIYVQQNTFRRFTGHGDHWDVLRILY